MIKSPEMAPPKLRTEDIVNPFSPPRMISPTLTRVSEGSSRSSPTPAEVDVPPTKKRNKGQSGSNLVDPIVINLRTRSITNKPRTPTPDPGTKDSPAVQNASTPIQSPHSPIIDLETLLKDVNMIHYPKVTVIQDPPVEVETENIRDSTSDTNDCPHSASFSTPLSSEAIISNPFTSTMLACLRQVKTLPCDLVSPAIPSNPRHRLKVYACYQQHWYPKINMPVLTLVAPCGITIGAPILRRESTLSASVTFMVSSTGQQEYLTFNIPLLISRTLASSSVVLTSGPSSSCPDTYTSYIVKTTAPDLNLVWIKVFHLSVLGCFALHARSLYTPMRPASTSEFHILGLSAARTTTYQIMHQEPSYLGIRFLHQHELQAIGWQKNPKVFTNLWKPNTTVFLATTPLMEQMQFAQPSYFPKPNVVCIASRKVITVTDPSLVPLHYPPTSNPVPPAFCPIPALFFGQVLKPLVVHRREINTTVAQLLAHLVPPPGVTRKDYFLQMFNVPPYTLENEAIIKLDLFTFLSKYAMSDTNSNGLCNFRHINSFKEPYTFTIPRTWVYLNQHPALKDEASRTQHPSTEEHDWA
jgi:hypothetical protein